MWFASVCERRVKAYILDDCTGILWKTILNFPGWKLWSWQIYNWLQVHTTYIYIGKSVFHLCDYILTVLKGHIHSQSSAAELASEISNQGKMASFAKLSEWICCSSHRIRYLAFSQCCCSGWCASWSAWLSSQIEIQKKCAHQFIVSRVSARAQLADQLHWFASDITLNPSRNQGRINEIISLNRSFDFILWTLRANRIVHIHLIRAATIANIVLTGEFPTDIYAVSFHFIWT